MLDCSRRLEGSELFHLDNLIQGRFLKSLLPSMMNLVRGGRGPFDDSYNLGLHVNHVVMYKLLSSSCYFSHEMPGRFQKRYMGDSATGNNRA